MLLGADLSHFQQGFDFHHAKNVDGLSFVICKVSESDHMVDATWPHNRAAAASVGLRCGGYGFIRPGVDGVKQAHWYLQHLGDPNGLLWPIVDVELDDPERVGVDREAYCDTLEAWLAEVLKELGHHSIIYSYASMWAWMGSPAQFGQAGNVLWEAAYPTIKKPLAGWKTALFHQYDDHGSAGGLHGSVDLDRFNGALADLDKFIMRTPAPKVP